MSSNHIYPYVYRLTHKETGQFYIGYRCANKVQAARDLGHFYKSSSKLVKQLGFENFHCNILAEFFDKEAAHNFECELIRESIKDPLILNQCVQGEHFRSTKHSEETKRKIAEANRGKHPPERVAKNKPNLGRKWSDETRAIWREQRKGVPKTEEHKLAMAEAARRAWLIRRAKTQS